MALYTLELREITENNVDIFAGWTYPIFDEKYRAGLNQKIIRHYYFREIGVETVGRFIYNLNTRMNEIMPYFNEMYKTTLMTQRIFDNNQITETFTKTTTENATDKNVSSGADTITNNGTDGTTTTAKKLHSDTPQGRITLSDTQFVSNIDDDSGTENVTRNNTETNTKGTTITTTLDHDNTESYTLTRTGNIGIQTDAWALGQYRDSILNVDIDVINALNDLFMGVY